MLVLCSTGWAALQVSLLALVMRTEQWNFDDTNETINCYKNKTNELYSLEAFSTVNASTKFSIIYPKASYLHVMF